MVYARCTMRVGAGGLTCESLSLKQYIIIIQDRRPLYFVCTRLTYKHYKQYNTVRF